MLFAFCLLRFQLGKAGMDHARREMARGSADSIGFFLTLSAEVMIISISSVRDAVNNEKLQSLFISNKVNSRNGLVQPVDVRWEYAGEFN